MSNCLAVRHFPRGTLCVHMNPLVVRRGFGELIDSVLIDDGPIRKTNLFACKCLGIFYGIDYVQVDVL